MGDSFATDRQRECFAEHTLDPVEGKPGTWWFRRADHTVFFSLVVVDTPVGVMLAGDIRFSRRTMFGREGNGALWFPGYSIHWLGGRLSEDYLLEKAMGGAPSRRAAESTHTLAGWIVAAQQRFAELWAALSESEKQAAAGAVRG